MAEVERPAEEGQEDRPSFFARLLRDYGQLLADACEIVITRQSGQQPNPEQVTFVTEYFPGLPDDDKIRGSAHGDIFAAGLTGMLRAPNQKVNDLMLQIEGEDGIAGLTAKYQRGEQFVPFARWGKDDQRRLYKLELQLEPIVDRVDIGEAVVSWILGRTTGIRFRAFSHCRRSLKITRGCLLAEGDVVKRDLAFGRWSQDSVRRILEMKKAVIQPTPAGTPTIINPFLIRIAAAAQQEKARLQGGADAWAQNVLEEWLAGKTRHEEPPPEDSGRVRELTAEIEALTNRVSTARADLDKISDPDIRAAVSLRVKALEDELGGKQAEFAALQAPATPTAPPALPAPATFPAISPDLAAAVKNDMQRQAEEAAAALAAEIARLEKEVTDQETAAKGHDALAAEASRNARAEGASDDQAENLFREARILRVKAKAAHDMAAELTAKIAELRAKQPTLTPTPPPPPPAPDSEREQILAKIQELQRKLGVATVTASPPAPSAPAPVGAGGAAPPPNEAMVALEELRGMITAGGNHMAVELLNELYGAAQAAHAKHSDCGPLLQRAVNAAKSGKAKQIRPFIGALKKLAE